MDGVVESDGFKFTAHGFSTPALPFAVGHFAEQSWGFSSANIDNMLRSICSDPGSFTLGVPAEGSRNNTTDEVWWDIPNRDPIEEPAVTLENLLAKGGAFGTETAIMIHASGLRGSQLASEVCANDGMTAAKFGMNESGSDGGTEKRSRADVEELAAPPDKAIQRKQRRKTKNREAAARSRERKQAYTMGLESLAAQLEEDNARLLKEEAELEKERYKKLMENLIPVTENRKPSRITRVHSMEW